MKNQSSLLRRASLLALAFLALALSGYQARAGTDKDAAKDRRTDVIAIDAMAEHGKLEMPPAVFLHDSHTKALAAVQKDCAACHLSAGASGYGFRYLDADKVQPEDLESFYHESCIGCHADMAASGKKSGPQEAECRSCHSPDPVKAEWNDIGLDKTLHYKHIASSRILATGDAKTNCAACHHVYDATAKKLVWGKDKEDSCRACHALPATLAAKRAAADALSPGAGNALQDANGLLAQRPTLDSAAHHACVNCHLAVSAKQEEGKPKPATGPVDCAGCHSLAAQAKYAAASTNAAVAADTAEGGVPRLERGQPDAVLMLPAPAKNNTLQSSMRPVSFNHKFHETVTDDCRTCHHEKIDSCSSCHSLEGKAEGGRVNQAAAMHSSDSRRSCVGCHAAETKAPSCAGCHVSRPPLSKTLSEDSCAACHSVPVGVSAEQAENASLLQLDKASREALAKATVAEREKARSSALALEAVPDKVRIGLLSKDYQPSELPHRKIVAALQEKTKDSRLAAAFHTEATSLCQGCHHNSPASMTPPKCVSCHAVDQANAKSGRLPLAAAYHQQCLTCHERMDQKPARDDCAACHKPRGNQ